MGDLSEPRHRVRWGVVLGVVALLVARTSTGRTEPSTLYNSFYTGNDIYDSIGGGFSHGYIIGVTDALKAGAIVYGNRACIRRTVSTQQGKDIVAKYMRERPQERDDAAPALVGRALSETFPCPR